MKEYFVYDLDDLYWGKMSMWSHTVDHLTAKGWILIEVGLFINYLNIRRA